MKDYFRPLPQTGPARPDGAFPLAGGWAWFDRIEVLTRGRPPQVIAAREAPAEILDRLTAPRAPIAGLALDRPRIMGILNVTPDSFSDGGRFTAPEAARARARQMLDEGADILDIGGESTRPGAKTVPAEDEIARVTPAIRAIRAAGMRAPVSLDTRKAPVAEAGITAGATMLNDVSALGFDPHMARVAQRHALPICLMHAQGAPETMQAAPSYGDVLLDVYDFLEDAARRAMAGGIRRTHIVLDPGIGFGKTLAHNLALLARISLFHALGFALLVGASRKRFIGTISGVEAADERQPGSLAVALAARAQGVQILRVHDTAATAQAFSVWDAVQSGMWQQGVR
ncbi:MAG TPA: dihydropteroate synthase [Aliiroseovarius sp.]|nr:dihydropteroate synthase [Aliiroseovarius sp.]